MEKENKKVTGGKFIEDFSVKGLVMTFEKLKEFVFLNFEKLKGLKSCVKIVFLSLNQVVFTSGHVIIARRLKKTVT